MRRSSDILSTCNFNCGINLQKIMAEGLVELKIEHAEEVADLLARNFASNNPVWSNFNLDQKELHKFFLKEIKAHLESQERTRKEMCPEVALNAVSIKQHRSISTKARLLLLG